MKAWTLNTIGQIELKKDVLEPEVADKEVLVKMRAAGICGSDIPRIYETGAHKMPLVLGHEFSGEVVKLGTNTDSKWLGKRVGVFPLIPCKKCEACQKKHYEMCTNYNYLGSRTNGGFSEYIAVPEWNLIELPENVSFEQAAMLEPMAVAIHAIRQIEFDANATVAVCGLGTIGQLIVMFLLEMGVKTIYVIGSKKIQSDKVKEFGIKEDNMCNGKDANAIEWLLDRTNGQGVDVFFECVGSNETIVQAIEATGPKGNLCLVGNPCSDIKLERDVYWRILRKQIRLIGTWNSSFYGTYDKECDSDDWHYVIDCLKKGLIKPEQLITQRLKIEELDKGFEIMKNKEEYIKIMCCN